MGATAEGVPVIYKPIAGVRPLWDFDASTLASREVWTFRVAQAMNINMVPETVMGSGEYGPGAVQRFVEAYADEAVVGMINGADPGLWPIAVLDIITNNADRKAGHILRDAEEHLWAIDHGLTFHSHPKLRTILWGFGGRRIPQALLESVEDLLGLLDADMGAQFAAELSEPELAAMQIRAATLLETGLHPEPPEDRPAIPWPPY